MAENSNIDGTGTKDDNSQGIHSIGMVYTSDQYSKMLEEVISLDHLRGIHGMPYQFMNTVDTRIRRRDDTSFGRKYAEKIVARMPLLLLTPGNPKFMKQVNDDETRKNTISELLRAFAGVATGEPFKLERTQLGELLKEYTGKYYSLEFDYVDYFRYVNPMCRAGAFFLNIENEELDRVPLGEYGWHLNTNLNLGNENAQTIFDKFESAAKAAAKGFQNFSYHRQCIPFYIETDNQISETFTNDTTESMISGIVNGYSDQARELSFLLGAGSTQIGGAFDSLIGNVGSGINDVIDQLTNMANGIAGGPNIFNNLVNAMKVVTTGGRLIFPEIWSDSSFSRSYSISMKLATPDGDKISWFLNIYVPLCHLLAMVLPRQADKHGYSAPFLVRAFYKGLFNIDMGIITDMTFTKGKEGCWTKEGLPTVVDVNFTIKDLYPRLSMTNNNDIKYNMMANTAQMDYIANACGVNINVPDIERYVRMYFAMNVKNKIQDAVTLDAWGGIEQWATKHILNIFTGFR